MWKKNNHHWLCSDTPGQYYCNDCPAKGWWSQMYRKIVEYDMTPQEIRSIKNAATEYAKKFLTYKYHDEYQELYKAYCFNRGVHTIKGHSKVPVDERLILIETVNGDN